MGQEDLTKLITAVIELKDTMNEFRERRQPNQQVVQQYNVGGTAMWIVVVAAAVIFTAAITQGPRLSDLERKVERQQDYLNNIYQQAPWLRPKEEDNVDSNHHHQSTPAATSG